MVKQLFIIITLVFLVIMLLPLMTEVKPFEDLSLVSQKYVNAGPDELGSQNLVTAVVVTYRGLDTLGEVAVLFIATAGIGFFLRKKAVEEKDMKSKASVLVRTGTALLLPLILLLGVYIFLHGHLTPGGGFQGGVVIASGILLLMLAQSDIKINISLLYWIESLSGAFYVIIGILGLALAGGFLDNRFLPLGDFGRLFSAGAIPIIYSLIGLKVGAELVGILNNMQRSQ
ncbi:MAG: Na(+)/H(+) antiporter subunit B [Candidatus Marinimicrobia bacterium]|nr:Na(+)/H(+) antiporter subunit B [Candidatus Neomarinimicrobiota bacterium]